MWVQLYNSVRRYVTLLLLRTSPHSIHMRRRHTALLLHHGLGGVGQSLLLGLHVSPECPAGFIASGRSLFHGRRIDGSTMTGESSSATTTPLVRACCWSPHRPSAASSGLPVAAAAGILLVQEPDTTARSRSRESLCSRHGSPFSIVISTVVAHFNL